MVNVIAILIFMGFMVEIVYRPRLDYTEERELLLWYEGKEKRVYKKIL